MPETPQLAASYAHCRGIARAAARNFYYGICLLPVEKRDALCAIYAFMREADDISDSPGETSEKQRRLAAWRGVLDRALAGDYAGHPALPAFHHAVSRYAVPPRYLHDLISGTEMDLTISSYPTFDRLSEYCYRVAGTVGLTCLYVFGFRDPRAPALAEKLGIAFQLTNILRDVSRDYEMGRVYIAEEDLARFGCRKEDLARGSAASFPDSERESHAAGLPALLRFHGERAWAFYHEGVQLLPLISLDSRPALWALVRIYSGLLARIEARGYDVFSVPAASLSAAEKAWIMLRARLGWWSEENVLPERGRDRRRLGRALLRRRAG